MMNVEIVVACAWFNRADYLKETIDSLLSQEFDSYEIVLVNDGSTDPRVRGILDQYDNPRLRVIHQSNVGFVRAITRAIDASTAPYIAIQGAGDISSPDRLHKQWAAFSEDPSIGIVGCHYKVRNVSNSTEILKTPVAPRKGQLGSFGFTQGELMYRRAVYESVGGYRSVFSVGQGSDLWMRIMRTHEAHIIPHCLYEQRLFSDGVSLSPEKRVLRAALSGIRKDNEIFYRKTGRDLISEYGAHAFAMFPSRREVRVSMIKATLMAAVRGEQSKFVGLVGWKLTRCIIFIIKFPYFRRIVEARTK